MVRKLRSATKLVADAVAENRQNTPTRARTQKAALSTNTISQSSSRKRRPSNEDANASKRTVKTVKVEAKKPDSGKVKGTSQPKKSSSIILGQDPYPDHPFPTPEQCQIVHDLLTQAHGPAVRPTTVPTASNAHAGCGEVPSVLDALMRTLLSANTSATNSTRAFRGLLAKYGSDPAHGGANWEAVRKGSLKDLFKAIEQGGLANVKSKAMKTILDEVYEDGVQSGHGLSLDYLHDKSDEEAMKKLTTFKGIGVKTATCVLMFCLQRAAFPVDTHVFRISRLLGWVPTPQYQREMMEKESELAPLTLSEDENNDTREEGKSKPKIQSQKAKAKRPPPVTRDTTFLHLDARVPAELKYGLHQLLIRHGRYCPTCNASGGRKYGIGQDGKQLVGKMKKVAIKEEKEDGTFLEAQVDVLVKEEPSDDEGGTAINNSTGLDSKIKEEELDESAKKPYIPIDTAGGTGHRTGGNPDGSCILGDMISWERLV